MKQEENVRKTKILIGKPGLDGHDRGAKVVALALKEAGFEVMYTGLHQQIEKIVAKARDEHVDIIGLSIMSGAHLPLCQKLVDLCKEQGLEGVLLVVGGVIPQQDIQKLKNIGIHGVFPGGTPFATFIQWIREKSLNKEAKRGCCSL